MERQSDADVVEVKIPRPYPGGSYTIQSMGRLIDRLMGDRKARADAAQHLEPFLMRSNDPTGDPEPAEIPEPVPGGSEPITKGDDPAGASLTHQRALSRTSLARSAVTDADVSDPD